MESFQELPIGIDLGTTYSCIGVYRNGTAEIIPNEIGDRTTPSIVCFKDDEILTGEYIRNQKIQNPNNTIYAIKRIIGRNFTDIDVQEDIKTFPFKVEKDSENRPKILVKIKNEEKSYFPQDISAFVLKKLKKSAESFLNQSINKVVITVPAYFTESQKQATIDAAKIAGLEVLRIINEPTAAALAYGLNDKYKNKKNDNLLNQSYMTQTCNTSFEECDDDKKILVFDLGGGTLDVTLMNMNDGICEIKAHCGCMHLGGEDFDNTLLTFFIDEFKKRTNIDLNNSKYIKAKKRLKEESERVKRILSNEQETDLEIANLAEGRDFFIKMTRAKFNYLCDDLFKKCLEPIKNVLNDANWSPLLIHDVVLVGGSTRIPKIQSIISEFFYGKKLCNNLNPDEAIAYGATIQAAIIMGMCDEDYAMLDVCPFSLGTSMINDSYSKNKIDNDKDELISLISSIIIPRGSPIPIEKEKIYYPAKDYQDYVIIDIYEGEKKIC